MTRARGCAIGCVVVIVALIGLAGFGAFVGLGVFGLLRSSDVVQDALRRAREHPAVIEALGRPVEPGWWLSGSIHITGPSGTASLSVPVKGPKGSGTLYVEATKQAGVWTFHLLQLAPESGPRIDLLTGVARPAEPPVSDVVPRRTSSPEERKAQEELERVREELETLKREQSKAADKAAHEAFKTWFETSPQSAVVWEGGRVSLAPLGRSRCRLREVRYGLDRATPNRSLAIAPCAGEREPVGEELPSPDEPVRFVSLQLVYVDGAVSKVMVLRPPSRGAGERDE